MRSVVNEALDALIALAQARCPGVKIARGALPPGPGAVCELEESAVRTTLDGSRLCDMVLAVRVRDPSLRQATRALWRIADALSAPRACPSGEGWAALGTTLKSLPRSAARSADGLWTAEAEVAARVFIEGGGSE